MHFIIVICRLYFILDMQLTYKVTTGLLLQCCIVTLQVERDKHGFLGPHAQHIVLMIITTCRGVIYGVTESN